MKENVLGAQLYTVREATQKLEDLKKTFERVRKIGYTNVQISGIGPMDPKDVARALDDNGLACSITHMGWDRFQNDLDGVIETHRLWKCKHTAIGGLFGEEYAGKEGLEKFVQELEPVSAKLAAAGLDFSYHNHSHEFIKIGDGTWLGQLYETTTPDVLKAEIDTFWVQYGGGDPVEWIRKCAGRIPVLHLKDFVIGPDRKQRMAEIGEGNMNWPVILDTAQEAGVEWYLVEQDDCYGRDPFESLEISYNNLKKLGYS